MQYVLFFVVFIIGCLIGEGTLSSKEQAARESTSRTTCWVETSLTKQVKAQFGPAPKGLVYCLTFKGPVKE